MVTVLANSGLTHPEEWVILSWQRVRLLHHPHRARRSASPWGSRHKMERSVFIKSQVCGCKQANRINREGVCVCVLSCGFGLVFLTTACKSSSALDLTGAEACGHHGTDHIQLEPVFILHLHRQTLWQQDNQSNRLSTSCQRTDPETADIKASPLQFPSVWSQTVRWPGTSNKTQQAFHIDPFQNKLKTSNLRLLADFRWNQN